MILRWVDQISTTVQLLFSTGTINWKVIISKKDRRANFPFNTKWNINQGIILPMIQPLQTMSLIPKINRTSLISLTQKKENFSQTHYFSNKVIWYVLILYSVAFQPPSAREIAPSQHVLWAAQINSKTSHTSSAQKANNSDKQIYGFHDKANYSSCWWTEIISLPAFLANSS